MRCSVLRLFIPSDDDEIMFIRELVDIAHDTRDGIGLLPSLRGDIDALDDPITSLWKMEMLKSCMAL